MQSSKLFTLLGGLDAAEMRWLHKFLKSPFYNSNQKVVRLFEYIKKYYPDLASPKLAKETTFQYLFPKEKFAPQKMRKLMHELATLVEDFMVAQHCQKNQFARKKILTKELGQRNLYGLFEKNSMEITDELTQLPYRDKDSFLEQYLNDYQFFAHPTTNPQQDFIPKVFQLSETLDQFYFLQKLQLNAVLESAKHIYQVDETLPLYELIFEEIQRRAFKKLPVFDLYVLVIQLFQTKDNEATFNQLYDTFLAKKEQLGAIDKTFILKYLINYIVGKTNKGQEEYVKKGLALYKIGLNENLLIIKNRITEGTFINIAWWSAFLKDFEFSANFIEHNKQLLLEGRREEIVTLAKANLHFNQKDYDLAIKLLNAGSFSQVLNKLRAKILTLKSYFELCLMDASYQNFLLTQVENFERSIRREEKISDSGKLNFLNFAKYFKKLLIVSIKRSGAVQFFIDLSRVENISNKPWLNAKANFLSVTTTETK